MSEFVANAIVILILASLFVGGFFVGWSFGSTPECHAKTVIKKTMATDNELWRFL